jgi:hypothetical protein
MILFLVYVAVLAAVGWSGSVLAVRYLSSEATRADIEAGHYTASAVVRDRLDRAVRSVLALITGRLAEVRQRRRSVPAVPHPPAARPAPRAGRQAAPLPPFQGADPGGPGPAEQADVAGPVHPIFAAVAQWIRESEPHHHSDHMAWFRDLASGLTEMAQALRDHGDMQHGVIGLDPAAVQGTYNFAEVVGSAAYDGSLAAQQYFVVYEQVIDWALNSGKVLPVDARAWLHPDAI